MTLSRNDEAQMSAQIMMNDILSILPEMNNTLAEMLMHIKYRDPHGEEYRMAFRNLLVSTIDISKSALDIFDEMCKVNGNPIADQ